MRENHIIPLICAFIFSVCLFALIPAVAWDLKHQLSHDLADSNETATIAVDSATLRLDSRLLWIDTTYFPSANGYDLGWADQYLFSYNVAVIDCTGTQPLQTACDDDSGHIGIAIQSSIDRQTWYTIDSDTTIRKVFTTDGDSVTRHIGLFATDTLITAGTICGPLFRTAVYVYRNVDTTDNAHAGIYDTVWLGKCTIRGLGFEE